MNDRVPSLDAITVLQKALSRCGVVASPWALVEACAGELSLESFARCAREQDLETTLIELKGGDTVYLPAGAIVALEDGAFATVFAPFPGGAILEAPDGRRLRSGTGKQRPRRALDIRSSAPEGTKLVSGILSRIRREPHTTRAIAMSTGASLAIVALAIAAPILTHIALGIALPARAEQKLTLVAVAIAVLGLQTGYVNWLRGRAHLFLSTKLSEMASVDVVSHMVRQPFARLRNIDVGYGRQAATSAASAAEAIPTLVPQFVDVLLAAAFLAYTFVLDPMTAGVAGGTGVVIVAVGMINGRRRRSTRRQLLERTRTEQRALFETIVGIETVKSESVEGRMLARWLDALLAEEQVALDLRLQASTFATLLVALERIAFAAALLLMARRCLAGAASVVDLIVAIQASVTFIAAIRRLAELPAALSDYRANIERAEEALADPIEKSGGGQRPAEGDGPAVLMRDVWFRYEPEAPWVIRGFHLVVEPGESVMLSWPSGAGKSTLLRLLSGLLTPSRGDALVFGVDAARARRMVTYIPQTATLVPMSVMDNLRILSRGAPPQRILEAARTTGLYEIVSGWGMGMETVLAFGGANLSAGQRQLVLLTAAVASHCPFVLLDEALAHIDLKMRASLDIAKLFAGRTVISIVHDASDRERAQARNVELLRPELAGGSSLLLGDS